MTTMTDEAAHVSQGQSQSQAPTLQRQQRNVGSGERQFSLVGGAGLVLLGLSRRSLPGLGLAAIGAALIQRGWTGQCAVYSALGVNTAKDENAPSAEPEEYFDRAIHVEVSTTINRSPQELFQFWRDFKNLPRIMHHLKSVEPIDERRSHWTAAAPAGFAVQWDAEIINEEQDKLIAWRSLGNADVDSSGSVTFTPAPTDRGTEVRVVLDYIPPAGKLGSIVAKLFGEEPRGQIREDLRNLKRMMETGEIPTIKGQPRGNCGGSGKTQNKDW